jgi:hypothetical protein
MISKESKIILLLPPKTASMSIADAFKRSGISFDRPNKIVEYPIFHPKLSEICEIYDIKNVDEFNIIQFTRDPYHRFVSSYYHLNKITPTNKNITFEGMNFNKFVLHIDKCKSSKNFVKELFGNDSHYHENLRMKRSWSGVRMFDEQITYNDLGLTVNYFKIEDLSNNLKIIENMISSELPRVNFLNENPMKINYDSLLVTETKEIIYKHFMSDFKILNY